MRKLLIAALMMFAFTCFCSAQTFDSASAVVDQDNQYVFHAGIAWVMSGGPVIYGGALVQVDQRIASVDIVSWTMLARFDLDDSSTVNIAPEAKVISTDVTAFGTIVFNTSKGALRVAPSSAAVRALFAQIYKGGIAPYGAARPLTVLFSPVDGAGTTRITVTYGYPGTVR